MDMEVDTFAKYNIVYTTAYQIINISYSRNERENSPIIEKKSKVFYTNSGFSGPFIRIYWWTKKYCGGGGQYNLPVFALLCRDFS